MQITFHGAAKTVTGSKHIGKRLVDHSGIQCGKNTGIIIYVQPAGVGEKASGLKYFVDCPLCLKATQTIKSHVLEYNERMQKILEIDDDPFLFNGLKLVETIEDSIRLTAYKEPCVIISSSGTTDAGRVKHHINASIAEEKNTILFSGYCSPDNLGGQLLEGVDEIAVFNIPQSVKADIDQLKGLSAHGDTDDLCQFIACQDPSLFGPFSWFMGK